MEIKFSINQSVKFYARKGVKEKCIHYTIFIISIMCYKNYFPNYKTLCPSMKKPCIS